MIACLSRDVARWLKGAFVLREIIQKNVPDAMAIGDILVGICRCSDDIPL